MEKHLFSKPIDIISNHYIKIVGFLAYLVLISLAAYSAAYLQSQVERDTKIHKNQIEVIKQNYNDIQPELEHKKILNDILNAIETEEDNSPKIALIIDDCGINEKNTKEIIDNFPKEITLSFLPYANEVQEQVDYGLLKEHEIMLHLPMEAINYNEKGANTLLTSWDNDTLKLQTKKHLDTFTGYSSINNHTGSKLTQDKEKMTAILNVLKERNIPFLDSVTISSSVAYETAKEMEIPTAKRNIFIDHEDNQDYVYNQLLKAESFANKNGYAIVIGHPKDNTIGALKLWLDTLDEKDITLVPASAMYR